MIQGNKAFRNDYAKCLSWLSRYYVDGDTEKDPKWYRNKNVGIFSLYNAIIEKKRVQDKIDGIKEYYRQNYGE